MSFHLSQCFSLMVENRIRDHQLPPTSWVENAKLKWCLIRVALQALRWGGGGGDDEKLAGKAGRRRLETTWVLLLSSKTRQDSGTPRKPKQGRWPKPGNARSSKIFPGIWSTRSHYIHRIVKILHQSRLRCECPSANLPRQGPLIWSMFVCSLMSTVRISLGHHLLKTKIRADLCFVTFLSRLFEACPISKKSAGYGIAGGTSYCTFFTHHDYY